MPQQLIYTSAPRGVVAGRSGHCTVARSAAMREALMLQLEKLSYYQHLSLSGGQERPIYSCRVLDIRGSRYHVLSRIQDAGLDFTGRTNFLAHHLVFTPEEVRQLPSPPVILRGWTGWVKSWTKEPQLLEKEEWSALAALSGVVSVPATNWQQVTGDAVNGYSLLESRVGLAFRVDNLSGEQTLAFFAESLELLELRDARRDFHATAWQYTFTTSMQEQDNPADFRWRCLHSDNPASSRFAGPDCRPLSELRALRVTSEETILARSGRQAPRFAVQPQSVRITEGGQARLHAKAEGVPSPAYQWFTVDRAGNGQIVSNATNAEFLVQTPPLGLSRYVVRASNSQGDATSEVATLSVDPKPRLAQVSTDKEARGPANRTPAYVKSGDQIERQRRQLEAKQAEAAFRKNLRRKKVLAVCGVVIAVVALGLVFRSKWPQHKPHAGSAGTNPPTAIPSTETQGVISVAGPTGVTTIARTQLKASEELPPPSTNTERVLTTPPATPFELPEGWMRVPVGTVSNPHADFTDPRFNLSAIAAGFTKQGDNVWFVCKTNTASTFQATLIQTEQSPPGTVCGIMVRQSRDPIAAFLFVGANKDHVISYRRNSRAKFDYAWAEVPKADRAKPIFLRIQKTGDRLASYYTFEISKPWLPVGPTNEPLSAEVTLSGLVICSGTTSNKVVAKFGGIFEQ